MSPRVPVVLLGVVAVVMLAACSPNESPDQIRQRTARETATLKRDSKAVAEGIKDGLTEKKAVDLNYASKAELSALPGIDERTADHIIAERPYANTHQLVSRHVLSQDEYSRVQDRVTVTR
jgi:DNA uptake protein ComE-like DNA-binding protein